MVLGQVAGTPTIPLVFADNLKKGDGHKPPRTRDQRIARFVPIRIVLPADNVKEISLAECQFLRGPRLWLVVVERFNYLGNAVSHRQEQLRKWDKEGRIQPNWRILRKELTFFGGKIAIADLGVMEIW